jgi:phage protein D
MAATAQSEQHVAGVEIVVDGSPLGSQWRDATLEVKVTNSLLLPATALIRLIDPKAEKVDSQPLQIGTSVEIKTAAMTSRTTASIFKGQVAAVEPHFDATGCTIAIRAYALSHKLHRVRRTRTFQQVSASDMAKRIASEAGLSPRVTSTPVVHDFFQQSNETDWEFLWRLALMHDFEVVVEDKTLAFRPANDTSGAPTTLRWQEGLISFHPRISGIQQAATVNVRGWDPKAKANISGSAGSASTTSNPGLDRATVANLLGGGTTAVTDRVMTSAREASAIAQSTLDRLADSFYEAEGVAFGSPAIMAGSKVKIEGVGRHFGGTFTVTSSTHSYRGTTGYQTTFQISGRSSRTLLELMRPPRPRDWTATLVIGVVTNNNDPDKLGRVRVKYPSLSDSEESAWARIATPSAGSGRGILMLPQPNEEVVVGFEHGDARRPLVVGSVFNGRDKPGDELLQNRDGSLAALSNEKLHLHSKKDFEIKSDQKMTVEVKSDKTETIKGDYRNEASGKGNLKAQQYTIEAGTSLTVKGSSITVEASGTLTLKGASVTIDGSGGVNITGATINLG